MGHPEIVFGLDTYTPGELFGFVKCTVLPPQNLYHPVLPYRSQSRLLFPLCRTCADTHQTEQCMHTIAERSITGTWITPELDHAIQRGYTVTAMYEAWHFSKSARNKYMGTLINRECHKTYTVNFKKGIVDKDTLTVYPYGYIKNI